MLFHIAQTAGNESRWSPKYWSEDNIGLPKAGSMWRVHEVAKNSMRVRFVAKDKSTLLTPGEEIMALEPQQAPDWFEGKWIEKTGWKLEEEPMSYGGSFQVHTPSANTRVVWVLYEGVVGYVLTYLFFSRLLEPFDPSETKVGP